MFSWFDLDPVQAGSADPDEQNDANVLQFGC
jgi:hypothetical protein